MDLSELFGGGEGMERDWTIYFGEGEVQVLRWIDRDDAQAGTGQVGDYFVFLRDGNGHVHGTA